MTIYIIFFIILAIFSVRTVAYGVYAFKKEGKLAGISVFVLALGTIFTAVVILATRILQ
ncbi:MAG: hypothetical protein PUF08_04720 [Clostridiales bacterium]|nr:hypothetical protein [Clostridiales bacterium]